MGRGKPCKASMKSEAALFIVMAAASALSAAPDDGQTTTASGPSAGNVTYLGKPQTAEWLESQYKQFGDKIALVDGNYYDIGEMMARQKVNPVCGPYVDEEAPKIGEARLAPQGSKVLQVIDHDSVLVERPGFAGSLTQGVAGEARLLYHVRGIDTKTVVDGARFGVGVLVFAGTFRYTSTAGAARTVQSLVLVHPVTEGQFAQALAGGFALVDYKAVEVRPDQTKSGWGIGLVSSPTADCRTSRDSDRRWFQIVGKPIDPDKAPLTREKAQAVVEDLTTQLKKFDADSTRITDYIKLQADIAQWQKLAEAPSFAAKLAAAREQLKALGDITQVDVDAYKESRAKLVNSLQEAKKDLRELGRSD